MVKDHATPSKTTLKPSHPPNDAAEKDAVSIDYPNGAPPKRTFGLRAFDAILYPGITNFGVFGISLFATYLTKGGAFGKAGSKAELFSKEIMQKRNSWLVKNIEKTGMPNSAAETASTVFWSFADGSLLAPVIKMFEDEREPIAKSIDQAMGTRPDSDEPYLAEPKQSWGSVLGGRALVAGVVVPTAITLEKTNVNWFGSRNNLNHHLFYEPGEKLGQWAMKFPAVSTRFTQGNFNILAKHALFEAFYTSVCTAGLYFASRLLASKTVDTPQALSLRAMNDEDLGVERLLEPLKQRVQHQSDEQLPETPEHAVREPQHHKTIQPTPEHGLKHVS